MTVALFEPDSGRYPRSVEIDRGKPDSDYAFLEFVSPRMSKDDVRHTYALDRAEFIRAIKAEFGLVDPLELALSRTGELDHDRGGSHA